MIEQVKDAYTWRAVYDEYSYHQETDENCFADVDQSRVKALFLLPLPGTEGDPQRMDIPEGASPVFFRRRSIEINLATSEQARKTVHCIGWKRGDEASYLFVFDDGSTLLTDNLQAV